MQPADLFLLHTFPATSAKQITCGREDHVPKPSSLDPSLIVERHGVSCLAVPCIELFTVLHFVSRLAPEFQPRTVAMPLYGKCRQWPECSALAHQHLDQHQRRRAIASSLTNTNELVVGTHLVPA
jgi:hypothetical protein